MSPSLLTSGPHPQLHSTGVLREKERWRPAHPACVGILAPQLGTVAVGAGPSLTKLEPLTLNRAELEPVSESPGSGSKNIERFKTLTLKCPSLSCHPKESSGPDSAQSGRIQSSRIESAQ